MAHFDNNQQAEIAMNLAIGRVFALGSRPAQDGDSKKYEDARYVILCASEYLGLTVDDLEHNYAKDSKNIHHN
jgi:hypothetical protein